MLVDDKPLPTDLLENIGDANREVQGPASFVRSAGSEDAVPIRQAVSVFQSLTSA